MSERIDGLRQDIAELTRTVQEHKSDPATLDYDELANTLLQKQEELKLIRHGDNDKGGGNGELVGPEGFRVPASKRVESGRFAGQKVDELKLIRNMLTIGHTAYPSRIKEPSEELKALTATGSGTGDELVPTSMAAELWEDFFLESRIVSNIGMVPMPTDPFDMPLGLGDVTWYKGTQNTATTASDPATAKSMLTSTEQVCEVDWAYNLDEDAMIAVMPALRRRLQISGGLQMDKFVLNADGTNAGSGNINEDDGDPDDDNYFLSAGQDGIRHLWLVDNTSQGVDAGGDALADADILDALTAMGKYAVDPQRVAMFVDTDTYFKGLMNLDAVQTLDKYGEKAVVMTGELGKYRGVSIVPTAAQSKTEADGKVNGTPSDPTFGQISFANVDFWNVGFRRELLIEVDRDIQKRSLIMVVSFRIATAAHGTRASAEHTAGIYNISVS